MYGLSPVCRRTCRLRSLGLRHTFPQYLHVLLIAWLLLSSSSEHDNPSPCLSTRPPPGPAPTGQPPSVASLGSLLPECSLDSGGDLREVESSSDLSCFIFCSMASRSCVLVSCLMCIGADLSISSGWLDRRWSCRLLLALYAFVHTCNTYKRVNVIIIRNNGFL